MSDCLKDSLENQHPCYRLNLGPQTGVEPADSLLEKQVRDTDTLDYGITLPKSRTPQRSCAAGWRRY